MNIKKIIREELEDLTWMIDSEPFLDKKWIIINDMPTTDPYMKKTQKVLFGLGWEHTRSFNKQRVIPIDKFEERQLFGDDEKIMAYIKSENLENKTLEFFIDSHQVTLTPKQTSLKIYYTSDIIKGVLKESEEDDGLDWIRAVPDEIPEIEDDNKFLVLVDILGIDEVFGSVTSFDDTNTDFEQNSWDHYGIETFTLENGQEWAVGSESEFDYALNEYWKNFVDDVGIEGINNFEEYLFMSDLDRRLFAQEMSDSYADDMSDREVVEYGGYDEILEELEELEDEISRLEDERDGVDTSIDDQISDLESKKEGLINKSREEVREEHYDRWYECLEDPYRCLVSEHGFFMDGQDLINSRLVSFDSEDFRDDMVNTSDWGDLSSYDGLYYEKDGYIAIRLN